MQSRTEVGTNHSGMQQAEPEAHEKMLENIQLTKPRRGDERDLARVRTDYARDADPVGTLPDPAASGLNAVLMDKLGARLAFERAGTRLYDALMAKCQADRSILIPMRELQHIRDQEAIHFALVGAAIQALGGDPTAQTPEADVTGVENMGLMQVLTDPKTTVAQALHAILIAEMTDNAAWEELVELTTRAGYDELVARFIKAHEEEIAHLHKVRGWYKAVTQALV